MVERHGLPAALLDPRVSVDNLVQRFPALAAELPGLMTPQALTSSDADGSDLVGPDEVRRAAADGAAYAFLSPYADGGSKPGRTPLPAGAFAGHPIPVFALGGITPANARSAREAGAHGVAVMGAVMAADDPAQVVVELLEAVA